jgi:hypothetical protein
VSGYRQGALQPAVACEPLRWLSYHTALNKGADVVKPLYLAKSVLADAGRTHIGVQMATKKSVEILM